ncbi:hypothetical protein Pelo_1551 [Pelomyxa schiedti]|nr:hypothetical protein Pelo_1551 [Pelomyxa schiedti]
MMWKDLQSLRAVDTTGKGGMWKLDPCPHCHQWMGEPVRVYVSRVDAVKQHRSLFMTRSQPADCIADGDELCIVVKTYKGWHSSLRIVDICRCFKSQELVVTKVMRDYKWNYSSVMCLLSDREKTLFLVTKQLLVGHTTVIQNVVSGEHIALQSEVEPVDEMHHSRTEEKPGKCGVFETGTNKIVREWVRTRNPHWVNRLLFIKENDGRITCSDALSGTPIASFSVLGVQHPTLEIFPVLCEG